MDNCLQKDLLKGTHVNLITMNMNVHTVQSKGKKIIVSHRI